MSFWLLSPAHRSSAFLAKGTHPLVTSTTITRLATTEGGVPWGVTTEGGGATGLCWTVGFPGGATQATRAMDNPRQANGGPEAIDIDVDNPTG